MIKKHLMPCLALLLCLTGCGGGGGGGPANAPKFNLDAVIASRLSQSWGIGNLQWSSNSIVYRLGIGSDPSTDGTVNGVTYKRAVQNLSVRPDLLPMIQTHASEHVFTLAPTRIGFTRRYPEMEFTAYTTVADLPASAVVGQSGRWLTGVRYENDSSTNVIGTQSVDWSLEADVDPTLALACLAFTTTGARAGVEKQCYKLNATGEVVGARITATRDGASAFFE